MIILDLDDTLIDHSFAERSAAHLFGEEHSVNIPGYDASCFGRVWRDLAEMHMASFLRREIDFREQRRRRIRAIFGKQEMCADEADALFGRYLRHYQAAWKLFPDVGAFLEKHRSEGLAVLSDGSQEQQEAKLASAGITHFFQFVVTAESTGLSKPDPRMFHHLCDLAGITAGEACYIGDNLEKDAIGANRAGLRGVWLNRNGQTAPDGVESIATLAEYQSSKGVLLS